MSPETSFLQPLPAVLEAPGVSVLHAGACGSAHLCLAYVVFPDHTAFTGTQLQVPCVILSALVSCQLLPNYD